MKDTSGNWRAPGFEQTDNNDPVVCVSWDDAEAFVSWLRSTTDQHYQLLSEAEWEYAARAGKTYQLLSEAEWEYAARAGTTTRYWWGNDLPTPEQANFGINVGKTTEVGSYPANPWGLYDMNGNVWEWVEDCWHESYQGAPSDGSAWTSGDCSRRVLRGGSWSGRPEYLRSANRGWYSTDHRNDDSASGLPGRSAESGAYPLNLRPFTPCDLGRSPAFPRLLAPRRSRNGRYGMGKGAGRAKGRR